MAKQDKGNGRDKIERFTPIVKKGGSKLIEPKRNKSTEKVEEPEARENA